MGLLKLLTIVNFVTQVFFCNKISFKRVRKYVASPSFDSNMACNYHHWGLDPCDTASVCHRYHRYLKGETASLPEEK